MLLNPVPQSLASRDSEALCPDPLTPDCKVYSFSALAWLGVPNLYVIQVRVTSVTCKDSFSYSITNIFACYFSEALLFYLSHLGA